MISRNVFLRGLAFAVFAVLADARLGAQLAANSPFLPAQTNAPATPAANEPLEFTGMISAPDGGVLYRVIYDRAKRAGAFLKLNERKPELNLLAKSYDAANKSLTIEHEGRTLTLPMREAKVVSGGAMPQLMPQPMPMPVGTNVPPAVTQSGALNPTPAQEAQRLEAVAQEVARRRALRDQASQQVTPGAAAPAAPVPPPVAPTQNAMPAPGMQQR